jgi:hypothetical protein
LYERVEHPAEILTLLIQQLPYARVEITEISRYKELTLQFAD